MPPNEVRPPAGNRGAQATAGEDVDTSIAAALAGAPCARRRLWVVVVAECPHCSRMHTHRAGNAARLWAGLAERSCPVTGRSYVLAPSGRPA